MSSGSLHGEHAPLTSDRQLALAFEAESSGLGRLRTCPVTALEQVGEKGLHTYGVSSETGTISGLSGHEKPAITFKEVDIGILDKLNSPPHAEAGATCKSIPADRDALRFARWSLGPASDRGLGKHAGGIFPHRIVCASCDRPFDGKHPCPLCKLGEGVEAPGGAQASGEVRDETGCRPARAGIPEGARGLPAVTLPPV